MQLVWSSLCIFVDYKKSNRQKLPRVSDTLTVSGEHVALHSSLSGLRVKQTILRCSQSIRILHLKRETS